MARIKGILFDLGETLLDFGKVDVLSLFEAGARRGYEYLRSLGMAMPQFGAYHSRQLWAIRWNYFKSRFTGREFNSLDVLGKFSQKMGHRLSPQQTVELAWQWYEPLSRIAVVEDGARELLAELRDAGLKLGLVSNTFVPGPVLDRHLQRENLLDLLPVRVYSCDVGYRKPHPGIFSMALERTGLQGGDALFVGDSIQADILGANRAGMISVLKDPHAKHDHAKIRPAHRIARLDEIRGIIRHYNG